MFLFNQRQTRLGLLPALAFAALLSGSVRFHAVGQSLLLQDVTVIDGTGKPAKLHQNVAVLNERIVSVSPTTTRPPAGATVVNLAGKTLMPLLIDTHAHLGLLKGTTMASANYTPENIHQQLLRFQAYGIGAILSMGTDHPEVFAMRQASQDQPLQGPTIYTAGIGFGVKDAVPPVSFGMDQVNRPETVAQARDEVRRLAASKPDVIKIWVDDFWGKYPKMKPEIYAAIIDEAHKNGIRVAAHLYYLEDARQLVKDGLDIMAHSIRDKEIDDALLKDMKARHVTYIPTLSLDEFAYIYEGTPEWMSDPFFRASLEPGVYDLVSSAAYKEKLKANPVTPQEAAALPIALKNLKKIYDAGILVTLGTDAGAQPIRAMGFSEHMELELLVKAGISPVQAIKIATANGAQLLKADKETGTLEPGKQASFLVLDKNPAEAITNTRTIAAVWKNGRKVNDGPLTGYATLPPATGKITMVATISIFPGSEGDVLRAATAVQQATKREAGCETFAFNTRKDDPSTIVFWEVFTSQAALDAHRASPHTQQFLAALKGKVQGDGPAITFLNQLAN
jgi:imidazolonepropionase-like amidohydrolase/quinol monooxygenase YgiN